MRRDKGNKGEGKVDEARMKRDEESGRNRDGRRGRKARKSRSESRSYRAAVMIERDLRILRRK